MTLTATAVLATDFGGPENLRLVEHDVPAPGRGEATIRVRAIGVNPLDRLLHSGALGADPGMLPLRLGQELAGIVIAVGPEAVGPAGPLHAGDEVLAWRRDIPGGGYATEVTWPASIILPKPAGLGFEPAAGLLLAGAAAVHALAAVGLTDGDTLVVHGASGAVGQLTAQLAALRGARVIGTASDERHDGLRALGVLPVGYGPGLAERLRRACPGGFDAAVDAAGTDEALDASLELVPDRTRIATLVNFERGNRAGIKTLGIAGGATDAGTEVRANAWIELLPLAASGRLHVPLARTFPLADVAEAHRLVATGHAGGKIILVPKRV